MTEELRKKLSTLPRSPEGHWEMSHSNIVLSLGKYNIKTMLEIGFNTGFSGMMFLEMLNIEKFYSIDIGMHKFVEPVQKKFKDEYGDRFYPLIGDSLKIRETELNDMEFDLIFIDGCHQYPVALNDWLFAMGKCKYILLDDTSGASPGVTQLIDVINHGTSEIEPFLNTKVELLKDFKIGAGAQLYKYKN